MEGPIAGLQDHQFPKRIHRAHIPSTIIPTVPRKSIGLYSPEAVDPAVPKQDPTKRFRELVADWSDTELGAILGITADGARKLRVGDTKTLKLHMALKLARELHVSPWYLAGEPEPERGLAGESLTKARGKPQRRPDDGNHQNMNLQSLRDEIDALNARVHRLEAAMGKRRGRQTGAVGGIPRPAEAP